MQIINTHTLRSYIDFQSVPVFFSLVDGDEPSYCLSHQPTRVTSINFMVYKQEN